MRNIDDLLISGCYKDLLQRGSCGYLTSGPHAGHVVTVHRVLPDGRASFAIDGKETVATVKNIRDGLVALDLRERTSRQHAEWRLIESMTDPPSVLPTRRYGVDIDLDVDLQHPLVQVSWGKNFWLLDTSCLADLVLDDQRRLEDGTLRVRAHALKLLCESVWGEP